MSDIPPTEGSNIVAMPTGSHLSAAFSTASEIDALISRIEAEARSHAPDLTTGKGRKAIASLAYRVAQSKTALDKAGKSLTDDARAKISAVDAQRRVARDRLDALKAEIRAPLDEWEAEGARREEAHAAVLRSLEAANVTANHDSSAIKSAIDAVGAVIIDTSCPEHLVEASTKRAATLAKLQSDLEVATQREADRAELDRLRAEAAVREREDAARAEAEQHAKDAAIAAEQAEARRVASKAAEVERAAQIARDREEAARQAVEAEKARAANAAKEAEARHAKEMADVKARQEAAAQAERDRAIAERKAAAEARAKREADESHRTRIKADIVEALGTMRGAAIPSDIADALMSGKIPHCEVKI